MNQVAVIPTFDKSVPAFLQNANMLALNQKAVAGLSAGAPPRVSFKGSRFRLIAADGVETPCTDVILTNPDGSKMQSMGVALDVIVVDAAAQLSKFYYDKAYDPNADDMSPACFSDNGVGPSVRAQKPQNLTCAGCPMNAWGSKVTPQGSQVKACSDVKKIALVPVHNISGPAYMLGIPAASLKTWNAAVSSVSSRNIPFSALVIRLSFDTTAEYPKLVFNPVRYITQEEMAAIGDLIGSDEAAELVGAKDTAISVMPGQTGGATAAQLAQAPAAYQPVVAQPVAQPVAAQPQPAVFTPPPPAAAPAFLQPQPVTAVAPVAAVGQPAPRRRGRPPAGAAAQAPATPVPPAASVAAPPSDVGAMLDKIMGTSA